MKAAALLAAAALLPASAAAAQTLQDTPDPDIASGKEQQRLDAARAAWAHAHIRSYRYTISVSCFCPRRPAGTVRVRDGRLVSYPTGLKQAASVPRLFKLVRQAIADKAADLRVTYDKRGVPTSIAIDRSKLIADEEIGYRVRGLSSTS